MDEPTAQPIGILRIASGVFLGLLAFTIFVGLIGVLGAALFAGHFSGSVLDSSVTSNGDVTQPSSPGATAVQPPAPDLTGHVPSGWADCGEGYTFVAGEEMCAPDKN